MADLYDKYGIGGGSGESPDQGGRRRQQPRAQQDTSVQGGDLYDRYGVEGDATAGQQQTPEEGPDYNWARRMAGRTTDLVGNLFKAPGRAWEAVSEAGAEMLPANPGYVRGSAEQLEEQGYDPDISLGGYGVDFVSDTKDIPRENRDSVGRALQGVGNWFADAEYGYEPTYGVDRILEDPSIANIAGFAKEQGPAAAVDMAALFANTPAYLVSRTQEHAEGRARNQDRERPDAEDYLYGGAGAGASVALDRLALGRLLPGGSGKPVTSMRQVPGAAARGAGREAGTEAVQEGGIEYAAEAAGTKAGYDPAEAAKRALGGGILGAAMGGPVGGVSGTVEARRAVRQQMAEDGQDPDAYSDEQIDEYIRQAEEASAGAAQDPEQVQETVGRQTGTDARRPVGEGQDPREARRQRRQVERDLGSLFADETDVLRRDEVEVTEDGINVPEGARPAVDASGRQANPDTMARRAEAAAILDEMGVERRPEDIDVLTRYLEQGIDPRSADNAFSRAARSGDMREVDDLRAQLGRERTRQFAERAFNVADRRRQRRREDFGQQGRREDFEPERDYRSGTAREEDLTPRMRQELEARSRQVPSGVNEGQPGGPRDSVDRISDTQVAGRRGEFIAGDRGPDPGPEPTAREGSTYEGRPSAREQDLLDRIGRSQRTERELGRQLQQAEEGSQEATQLEQRRDQQRGTTQSLYQSLQRLQADTQAEAPAAPDTGAQGAAPAGQASNLRGGEDLVSQQLQETEVGNIDLTPEQFETVAREVTRRGTDAVTGWIDARGGSMKQDALDMALEVAENSDQPVRYVSLDISNLGGLNSFHNDVAEEANQDFRAISDIVHDEVSQLGPLTPMRTGGDELSLFVQGADRNQLDQALERAADRVQQHADERGFGSIPHAKTGQENFGVGIQWGTTNVEVGMTPEQVFNEADAQMKTKADAASTDNTGQQAATDQPAGSTADQGDTDGVGSEQSDASGATEAPGGPDAGSGAAAGGESGADAGDGRQRSGAEATSVRGTDGESAPGDGAGEQDLTEGDGSGSQESADSPNTKLYGGIPLDAIADAVKKAVGGEVDAFRNMAERIGQLWTDARATAGGFKAEGRATKRSLVTDMWRVTLASLDGDFRTLVKKFNSPTLRSLPDMFHAPSGGDAGVKQTMDEAVQSRNKKLLEVDEIMSYMRDNGIEGKQQQEQVIRMVENPKTPRRGPMGEAANRIEQFLKEELEYLREAGVEVGEVTGGYFPREVDTGKASAEREKFIRQARKAYEEMGQTPEEAALSASAYWESTVYGTTGRPGMQLPQGQTPSFVQSRKFSKAAAEHLSDFRVTDIDAVLGQYTMRATKRAEIARRFGDNWSQWDQIRDRMLQEDPDVQDILPQVEDRVALSSGLQTDRLSHGARAGLSAFRTWTTLATLPKAVMPSIGELAIAPVRGTTGNIPGDIAQHGMNILSHLQNFTTSISQLGRTERMEAAWEMAEDIGIIAGTGHNSLMAARFAGGDPVGRVQSEVLASFFRRNMLEHLTNYTRVTTMQQGQVFMRRLAKQMERHPQRSSYFLRELGVPQGQEGEFATWLRQFGDNPPGPSQVTGRWASTYRNALQRFTDQTVQRPSASTKPKYASHPLGAVIFQLQAFGYAFQKNVINRYGRVWKSDMPTMEKVAFSAATLPGLFLLVGLQGMVRYWRDEIFDPEINERKTDMAQIEGAISQAGLLGVADPYLQSLTGIRYQRNPMVSFMGPAFGGVSDATGALLEGALNNSSKTNTGERNMAEATYDWMLEPMMQAALTAAPGGPVTGPLSSAATIYGVPKGRDPFTTAVAGPDQRQGRKPPIQGTIEWLTQGAPESPDTTGREGGRSAGRSAGRGAGGR